MNVNDLVYLHMFDLEVTLTTATKLIAHNRFGKIKAIKYVDLPYSDDKALRYTVELKGGNEIHFVTYDPVWTIIPISELKEKIEKVVAVEEIKQHLLSQIEEYIKEQD